ncbi:MAG: glutamyl-tRNA reductase [Phycisphaerae bacterium]
MILGTITPGQATAPLTLAVVGCNHRTAPIATRERLALDDDRGQATLAAFHRDFPGTAGLILSTCNRFEIYIAAPGCAHPTLAQLTALIAAAAHLAPGQLQPRLYHHHDADALGHLCRVAASLDSMLVGDPGIAHQVGRAIDLTRTTSRPSLALDYLSQCVRQALTLARNALPSTLQSQSLGSLAVQHARQITAPWNQTIVLVIGAGRVATSVLAELCRIPPARLILTNRNARHAAKLARRHAADAVPYDQLTIALSTAQVVISTTAAPEPILTPDVYPGMLHPAHLGRKLLIDLAVPRNIDPSLADHHNTTLLTLDDLRPLADRVNVIRRHDILKAEQRIQRAVESFGRQKDATARTALTIA